MPERRAFAFAFDPSLERWAKWFGVLPTRSFVAVDERGIEACFGPWRMASDWANVAGVERTGPYTAWKVAGPAHLSVADRGLTMSATSAAGACVSFHRPVRAIEPLGFIRHPAATLGVEDVDGFVALVEAYLADPPPAGTPPEHPEGGYLAALRAAWHWRQRERSVDEHEGDTPSIDVPAHGATEDAQTLDDGAGAVFHRRYSITAKGAELDAAAAMAAVQRQPSLLAEDDFAPFVKVQGELGTMREGDRYVIDIAGPWKGAVEVIGLDDCSFRLTTLDTHMEAGVIDFRAVDDGPETVSLTIESWARSRDRVMDALYDKLGLAKAIQSEMWSLACEHFVDVTGGVPAGPVEVVTERAPS